MLAPLRIGTRGSALALWQAHHLQTCLARLGRGSTLTIIRTSGDRIQDRPLAALGGKGLFTKEIEESLLANQIDCAIHSLKDVPAELPPGLILSAIMVREDPRDALIAAPGMTLQELPQGARVGTSSLRRQSQLMHLRPDLDVRPLRGNVDTRLRRCSEGDFDAIILAAAGLKRLEKDAAVVEWISPEAICPAVGQGALALECRTGDQTTQAQLAPLHHAETAACVRAERALLARLQAGCQAPVAAYATLAGEEMRMQAVAGAADGSRLLRTSVVADRKRRIPEEVGIEAAERLLEQGAAALLAPA